MLFQLFAFLTPTFAAAKERNGDWIATLFIILVLAVIFQILRLLGKALSFLFPKDKDRKSKAEA